LIFNMETEMQPKVQIKGIRDGLLITLSDGEWSDLQDALMEQLEEQADFLQGGKLAIDVGNMALTASEIGGLRDLLSEKEINLWAIMSFSPKTVRNAQALGLATQISKPVPDRVQKTPGTRFSAGDNAVLIKKTLRSGYSFKHSGHVIVIGDVNPGAEIIASGDVIVWGRLRGVVHAGADGDTNAVVCALDLSPTQLRISDQISVTPKSRGKPQPEIARLQEGLVVAETWNHKGR
jgi:septum site-determining protein MinC